MNKGVTIKTEKDLANFLEKIDDINYLEDTKFKLDETLIKLKLEGENFESSLTGSLILGLAQYQEKLYHLYLEGKYGVGTKRKITPEEAKLLEIKVTVKQGSTEVWIKMLLDKAGGVLEKMPADQVVATLIIMAGIGAVAYCLNGIGSTAVKEAFKTKRQALAEKISLSKDEVEKKKLAFLESTVKTAIEGMQAVSTGIVQAGPSRVEVNGKTVTTAAIQSVARELEPEPIETIEEQSVMSGAYRIQRVMLNFKKDSASVDIINAENGELINGLIVQPKHLYDGSYRVLKTAQDKQDVKLQIMVTKRNNRIHKAVLDKILDN